MTALGVICGDVFHYLSAAENAAYTKAYCIEPMMGTYLVRQHGLGHDDLDIPSMAVGVLSQGVTSLSGPSGMAHFSLSI